MRRDWGPWYVSCCAAAALALALMALAAPTAGAAKLPTFKTPGYSWNGTLPKVAPVVPGKLIKLGDGYAPRVLVDAAGTGQIAYTTYAQSVGPPSVLHDCTLLRGQTGCAANAGLVPPEDGPAQYDLDPDGPVPLSVGNELLMLTHRYPISETLPDGTSGYPTFLYTSEDAGKTFTGPGVTGNLSPSGNAIVWGGDLPQIAVITDTQTGGTFFQTGPAGAYAGQRLNLGDQGPDEAYNGELALDGDRPVAEFADLTDHIFIREYNGTGDIYDSASWSVARIAGQGYSQLVGGPSGDWLLYQKTYAGPLFVQQIVGGQPSGSAHQVTPNSDFDHAHYKIAEDASGRLTVGWFSAVGSHDDLVTSTSSDGSSWSVPQPIASGLDDPGDLALAAAGDGGGFAAIQLPDPGSLSGSQIDVAGFGTQVANGLKGLGDLDGDGLGGLGGDPNGSTSCTDVHFGDIDALAEAGCFLRDPSNPTGGAAISQGAIRLNGLEIIPDAGVKIVIDPRQHTINTTGDVRIVLRAPVIGDITIYHGELHVDLAGSLADAGSTLFDFDTSQFPVSLEGFPIDSSLTVKLTHDGVTIPISLKLPSYMGGVSGQATLIADNATGLHVSSLHIGVADLNLGALEIKDLAVDYTAQGTVWKGAATVEIPGGSGYFEIAAQVEFDHDDLTMGSFQVSVPFPGIPIFSDVYLDGFGGGFDLHPPRKRFFGSIDVGAIPLDPPNYTVDVTGAISLTFIDNGPVVVEVDGSGAIHGYTLATAKLIFQTNGYFEADGKLSFSLGPVDVEGDVAAFVDLGSQQFSASANLSGDIDGYGVSAQGVVSSTGVAACAAVSKVLHAGFGYTWGGAFDLMVGVGSCDISGYVIAEKAAVAVARDGVRRGSARYAVPGAAGAPFEDIAVTGAGSAPSVVLHGPGGATVVPVDLHSPAAATAQAVALTGTKDATTYVMVRAPGAGAWSVTATPESSAITSVKVARGYPPPKVTASVHGHGRARTLVYTATHRAGLSVQFAEQAGRVYRVIGRTTNGHGRLRFASADGPGGGRTIYAIVSEDGVARQKLAVARYVAPGWVTPGRVRGVHVRARGRGFSIGFGAAASADHYLVRIVASDGRRLQRLIGDHARHTLILPALGFRDRVRVTVTGVSASGRSGAATTASAQLTRLPHLPGSHAGARHKRTRGGQ
jgi:hypothetical protein